LKGGFFIVRASDTKFMYPFSPALHRFMKTEPKFYHSLKFFNRERFYLLERFIISRTPDDHPLHEHEVIGLFYLDKENLRKDKKPFFKQDFVVKKGDVFVSYTAKQLAKRLRSQYVRPLKAFFREYGKDKRFYHDGERWQHHYDDVESLPQCLHEYARRALESVL